jgi:mRNA interferase RelE/StbE
MAYSLNFTRQALKELEKINEPYYSNIKQAISNLTPVGAKLKLWLMR